MGIRVYLEFIYGLGLMSSLGLMVFCRAYAYLGVCIGPRVYIRFVVLRLGGMMLPKP